MTKMSYEEGLRLAEKIFILFYASGESSRFPDSHVATQNHRINSSSSIIDEMGVFESDDEFAFMKHLQYLISKTREDWVRQLFNHRDRDTWSNALKYKVLYALAKECEDEHC